MRKVAIIGTGITKFGELWDCSYRDLATEAGIQAVEDAKISGDEVDICIGGTMFPGNAVGQDNIGSLIADYLGLTPASCIRTEAACASGGAALHQAVLAVSSGHYETAAVIGVEKMTDVDQSVITDALVGAADREWEGVMGATFPGIYAMIARLHMHKYGTTSEQLAAVAVKNHFNGSLNPKAQFQNIITIEQVLKSVMIADPLRVLDCSPISDGASAVILVPADVAESYVSNPVCIEASTQASGSIALHSRPDITTIDASVVAGKKAYEMAGMTPNDIDLAEVHDCFTIAEICAIEDLGFFKKGDGGRATIEGETSLSGKFPVNTSGGLKACGHPVGATGIKQVVEIVRQLRGDAGERQVEDAEIGMTHNVGGSGGTAVVHILSKDRR